MANEEVLALRPREAAKMLSVSERTLWASTQPRGPIPCVRLGEGKRQTVLYSVEVLRGWLVSASGGDTGNKTEVS